jgi:hypothetical protein
VDVINCLVVLNRSSKFGCWLGVWVTGFVLVGKWLVRGLADQLIFCDESTVNVNVAMKNITAHFHFFLFNDCFLSAMME